jgi:hypothetical protein
MDNIELEFNLNLSSTGNSYDSSMTTLEATQTI